MSAAGVPFQELLQPFVLDARTRLAAAAPAFDDRFAPAAAGDFEHALYARLARVTSRPFYRDFVAVRPADARLNTALGGDPSEHYRQFIEQRAGDDLDALGHRYPMLSPLIAAIVGQWVGSTAELAMRLHADGDALVSAFGAAARVVRARTSLSDPHRGGRTVSILETENGVRLVYKPRSIALEAAFASLIDWCNAHGAPAELRAPRALERDGYGWMEHVDRGPRSDVDAERFYRNAGALTALLHLLRGTDCHSDNLIACGEQLVLIDAETLLQPEVRSTMGAADAGSPGTGELATRVTRSAGRTGMLPMWVVDAEGNLSDESALGAIAGASPRRSVKWVGIGTDAIAPAVAVALPPDPPARPALPSSVATIAGFADAIAGGFGAMYDFLAGARSDLLASHGPLARFAGVPLRFVYRPTRVYGAVLERALDPKALADPARFTSSLGILARPVPVEDVARLRIVAAEVAALRDLDVPYFETSTDSDALQLADGTTLPRWFECSGFDSMRQTLEGMCDEDRMLQTAIVRGMSLAHGAHGALGIPVVAAHDSAAAPGGGAPNAGELEEAAARIGEELASQTVRDGDGGAFWLGFGALPGADRLQFRPSGENLYDGNVGIALFLAALDRTRGDAHHAELIRAALQPVQRYLRLAGTVASGWFAERNGLGGATGLGSMVYGFTRIAALTGDAAFLDDARRAMRLITAERIAADRSLDVIDGSAGAILGLLSLYGDTDDADALRLAESCGAHLIAAAEHHEGKRVWRTSADRPLPGFSHGASGIAVALARLARVTSDAPLRDTCEVAVADALAFERPLLGLEDTRWCHGTAGIGLARLELAGDDARADLARMIEATRRGSGDLDHLCCGEAGRIELLLQASLADEGRARAAAMVRRASDKGGYVLFPPPATHVFNAGLFQGVAGIGYTLLRAAGALLPQVLSLS